jgi:hypothetical protein
MGENMSMVSLPLPSWTANITIIIFVLAFGRFLIKKIATLLENLLKSFNIEESVSKTFITFITSLFWLYILGIALINLPILFDPNIFPAGTVGNLLLTFVSYTFALVLPIVILYVMMEYKKKK